MAPTEPIPPAKRPSPRELAAGAPLRWSQHCGHGSVRAQWKAHEFQQYFEKTSSDVTFVCAPCGYVIFDEFTADAAELAAMPACQGPTRLKPPSIFTPDHVPECRVCRTPVKEMDWVERERVLEGRYILRCHGEQTLVILSREDVDAGLRISKVAAFGPPPTSEARP